MKEWSFRGNAEFSKKYGFVYRDENFDPNSIGTFMPFARLDSDMVSVNQMFKQIKFGLANVWMMRVMI